MCLCCSEDTVESRVVDHSWRVAHCTVGRMPHCRLPHSNTPTEHCGKECTYQVFIPLVSTCPPSFQGPMCVNALSMSSPFSTIPGPYPVLPYDFPCTIARCYTLPSPTFHNYLLSSNRLVSSIHTSEY